MGGLIPVPAHNPVPLRYNPYFGTPKPNGSTRLVADFSNGPDYPLNSTTDVGSITRSDLAKFPRSMGRIQHLSSLHPNRPISMVKLDVKNAYRNVGLPVRDMHATAHRVGSVSYVNARAMIGAQLAGDIMSPGVSVLCYQLAEEDIFAISYIDDVLIIAYSDQIDAHVARALELWHSLGWPLNEPKFLLEGQPSPRIVFLGLLLDASTMTLSVPTLYRLKLLSRIQVLLSSPEPLCSRALKSIAGSLQHVAVVVPFGRAFVRSLHPRAHAAPSLASVSDDLLWWAHVLQSEVPPVCFNPDTSSRPILRIASDASGSGFAAVCPSLSSFFSGLWPADVRRSSSTAHWECLMALFVVHTYGPLLPHGSILHLFSDSSATVAVFTRQSCRDPTLLAILRVTSLLQLHLGVTLVVSHIPGAINCLADHASRHNSLPVACPFRRQLLPLPLLTLGFNLLMQLPLAPNTALSFLPLPPIFSPSTAPPELGHLLPPSALTLWSNSLQLPGHAGDFTTWHSSSSPLVG